MTMVTEIAANVFRVSTYVPQADLQFGQFLVRDDEPLLFHTGPRKMFPLVREAIATVLDPSRIRWIAFSHFEADECGALNDWLDVAPNAEPVCSFVGAMVSVNDMATRAAHTMEDGQILETGKYRFRFLRTPHVPHCWEAGLLFEETERTLFCSDLFHQNGDVEPLTDESCVERVRKTLLDYQAGPFAHYMPYTAQTDLILQKLATLRPETLATMHGSVYRGNGERALRELAIVMREVLGPAV